MTPDQIKQADKQTAFNVALNGLRKQGCQSFKVGRTSGGCAYRGNEGTKCGIGQIIPDSHYIPEFDNGGVTAVAVLMIEPNSLMEVALKAGGLVEPRGIVNFLTDLQDIHDDFIASDYDVDHDTTFGFNGYIEHTMERLASQHNLQYTAPVKA